MISNTDFKIRNGRTFAFRQMHQAASFSGSPGIYALTVVHDFEVHAIRFEPANDLAIADFSRIPRHPLYEECTEFGSVGVAVYLMPKSTAAERARLAKALNDGVDLDLGDVAAA